MLILAFESSCDETSVSVVENGTKILCNLIQSQVLMHNKTGGIVPEVAAREHLKIISQLTDQALNVAGVQIESIDYIAATIGPGLPGALMVGFSYARSMAFATKKPFIPVDHIEGHIYANWLEGNMPILPAVALVVSGGHTELIYMDSASNFKRIGGTRDDAAGEAFDKVSRMLGAGYPGGPAIAALANEAKKFDIELPRAWLPGTHDFSFSGLKTAVLNLKNKFPNLPVEEIAWSFQESVVDVLISKTITLLNELNVQSVLLAGGVASNSRLREVAKTKIKIPVFIPSPKLCTDNAAMIAAAAFRHKDDFIDPCSLIDIYSTMNRGDLLIDKN
ncbi:MAG: N6-L-threonylcarbamoyladenine synthase [Chloroflexi bacterium]|jgi:N6-L-threonylcarbamoyladenine synthase|nr:MAG: N6-L-threonylcarbamoyladenine synthase [Chloroflexota bacterium]|tara:strand:+ start:878 stop:1879 length:1002 start_codon:yes stop_codon:yes gene_type:complete